MLSFLSVLVWFLIVIGTFAFLIGLLNGGQMALVIAPSGLVTAIFGVIGLALVQIGRANVHSAEINWEMLVLARKADRLQSQVPASNQRSMSNETSNFQTTNATSGIADRAQSAEEYQDVAGSLWTKQLRDKEGNILKAYIYAGGAVKVEKDGTTHKFASFLEAREYFNPE